MVQPQRGGFLYVLPTVFPQSVITAALSPALPGSERATKAWGFDYHS